MYLKLKKIFTTLSFVALTVVACRLVTSDPLENPSVVPKPETSEFSLVCSPFQREQVNPLKLTFRSPYSSTAISIIEDQGLWFHPFSTTPLSSASHREVMAQFCNESSSPLSLWPKYPYCQQLHFEQGELVCDPILRQKKHLLSKLQTLQHRFQRTNYHISYDFLRWIFLTKSLLTEHQTFCHSYKNTLAQLSPEDFFTPFVLFQGTATLPIFEKVCSSNTALQNHDDLRIMAAELMIQEFEYFAEVMHEQFTRKVLVPKVFPTIDRAKMNIEVRIEPTEQTLETWYTQYIASDHTLVHPLSPWINGSFLAKMLFPTKIASTLEKDKTLALQNLKQLILTEKVFVVSPGYRKSVYLPEGEYLFEATKIPKVIQVFETIRDKVTGHFLVVEKGPTNIALKEGTTIH